MLCPNNKYNYFVATRCFTSRLIRPFPTPPSRTQLVLRCLAHVIFGREFAAATVSVAQLQVTAFTEALLRILFFLGEANTSTYIRGSIRLVAASLNRTPERGQAAAKKSSSLPVYRVQTVQVLLYCCRTHVRGTAVTTLYFCT